MYYHPIAKSSWHLIFTSINGWKRPEEVSLMTYENDMKITFVSTNKALLGHSCPHSSSCCLWLASVLLWSRIAAKNPMTHKPKIMTAWSFTERTGSQKERVSNILSSPCPTAYSSRSCRASGKRRRFKKWAGFWNSHRGKDGKCSGQEEIWE